MITAAIATADYLHDRFQPGAALYVIGETGLRTALTEAGFRLVEGIREQVEAVVVGGDRQLTYSKLHHAIHHLLQGAIFIGTNPDLLVPTEQGFAPEAGTTLAALQAATGIAPTLIGKPERPLLDLALQRMQATPEHTAILGDRLETDILGGQCLGLTTILVTTGVSTEAQIAETGITPDHVVHGLDQVIILWEDQL
ncbi:MAG: HAD hydrolase-like protein [Halieaceae bacterium]|nr:HAD hydrolase-like protein [Halieaceae bacterium]